MEVLSGYLALAIFSGMIYYLLKHTVLEDELATNQQK
jgi:hypothetical protein